MPIYSFSLGFETMKIVLNGWQRLWIVFSLILFAVIILADIILFPSARDISHIELFEDKLSTASKEKLAPVDNKGIIWDDVVGLKIEMPNKHILSFAKGVSSSEAELVSKEYYHILLEKVYVKRFQSILLALAIWVGAIGVIYAFGWSIGWIYRGFKKKL